MICLYEIKSLFSSSTSVSMCCFVVEPIGKFFYSTFLASWKKFVLQDRFAKIFDRIFVNFFNFLKQIFAKSESKFLRKCKNENYCFIPNIHR
jgi:hypothetical protein